jgi:HEAT repeats
MESEVVSRLISDLGDRDADVWIEAVKELGRLRSREAVPPLCWMLGDTNQIDLRFEGPAKVLWAARGLGAIGDERAVPTLRAALIPLEDRERNGDGRYSQVVHAIRTALDQCTGKRVPDMPEFFAPPGFEDI